jgi:hypothetical protein
MLSLASSRRLRICAYMYSGQFEPALTLYSTASSSSATLAAGHAVATAHFADHSMIALLITLKELRAAGFGSRALRFCLVVTGIVAFQQLVELDSECNCPLTNQTVRIANLHRFATCLSPLAGGMRPNTLSLRRRNS